LQENRERWNPYCSQGRVSVFAGTGETVISGNFPLPPERSGGRKEILYCYGQLPVLFERASPGKQEKSAA